MAIEDDYRAHGALTKDQIEYLIVVNSVVQQVRDAAGLHKGFVYSILPRSETPIFQAMSRLRIVLEHADLDEPPEATPERASWQMAALEELAELEYRVDEPSRARKKHGAHS